MKKSALFLLPLLFLSCEEQKERHFIVVHNNYKDTTEVVAKYWRTCLDGKELPNGMFSITEFHSDNGASYIYNVDCIIARDSINNK